MEDKDYWEGTASKLLDELHFLVNTESKYRKLPETPNAPQSLYSSNQVNP